MLGVGAEHAVWASTISSWGSSEGRGGTPDASRRATLSGEGDSVRCSAYTRSISSGVNKSRGRCVGRRKGVERFVRLTVAVFVVTTPLKRHGNIIYQMFSPVDFGARCNVVRTHVTGWINASNAYFSGFLNVSTRSSQGRGAVGGQRLLKE